MESFFLLVNSMTALATESSKPVKVIPLPIPSSKRRMCPLRGTDCRKQDCEWWLKGDASTESRCAVPAAALALDSLASEEECEDCDEDGN
jgi:hypothetical protein